jgi:hypothetical protein
VVGACAVWKIGTQVSNFFELRVTSELKIIKTKNYGLFRMVVSQKLPFSHDLQYFEDASPRRNS